MSPGGLVAVGIGARRLTSCGIQPPATSFAFKMFRLLVRDEDLEIFEIALAIVAPWASEELLDGGTTSFLAHGGEVKSSRRCRRRERVDGMM